MNAWTRASLPGAGGRPPGCGDAPARASSLSPVMGRSTVRIRRNPNHCPVPRAHRATPATGFRAAGEQTAGPLYLPNPDEERRVQEMVIYGVSFDMVGKQ